MAARSSTVELIFRGITRGLTGAAAQARRAAAEAEAAERGLADARRASENSTGRLQTAEDSLLAARSQHDAALSRIGVAETNLEQVRARSGSASTRLGQAEAELSRVRQNGSTDEIQRAEAEVTRVREESDTAAAALQAAESRLASARANGDSSTARLLRAEEDLARARRENEAALGRLGDAEERNRRAQDDLNDSNRNGRGGFRDLLAGILGVIRPFTELADLVGNTSTRMAAFGGIIAGIGGPIVQAVVGLAEMAAVLGAIGEVVGVIGGLIGQALAGVPALLFGVAAAAGTVALGMDGIKKAAQAAAPAFERLKAAVSDEFAKQLTPVFQQLAKDIPLLTENFRDIAASVADLGARLVGVISSAAGMDRFQLALAGTADLVRGIGPGIASLFDGIIRAAAAAAPAMEGLGRAIGSIGATIGDVFSRLAADGTIQRAVQGLSATITGLGAVIGPIIELLIRMGAALGDSVGVALQGVGAGITQVIPFFEKLAQVAGQVLVDAFNQLGPPLRELVNSILPGASQGMDGFAALMHNVVLPAIAGFINFLRTDGIPGIVAFTRGAVVQFLEFATAVTSTVSSLLGVLSAFFKTLAVVAAGTPLGKTFLDAAAAAEGAKVKVDGLTASLNEIKSKTIAFTVQVPSDRTTGEQGALGVAAAMERVQPKTVAVTANVPSGPTTGTLGNQVLEGAIGAVINKSVTTTSNVPGTPVLGTQGNQALTGAIGAVQSKAVTTTGNVPEGSTLGKQGNQLLKGAIDNVNSKTVDVRANVSGESAVRSLISAIAAVHDKVVTVVSNVINNVARAFADGGRVPTSGQFLVGERGPELLTLDAFGGVITPAARTRQMLNAQRNRRPGATAVGGDPAASTSEAPITVNVMLSQDQIAGIAQVEIARRDRATKRTVLAGSGVTF